MKKLAARLFFILVPALALAIPLELIQSGLGFFVFWLMAGIGVTATKQRIERGEGL